MTPHAHEPGLTPKPGAGPYLPGFAADVFISYSHIDDLPFGAEGSRWVTEFHRNLDIRVRAYLGRAATIWRDRKLGGADVFSDEIAAQLRATGILVSVLTPSYLRSEWCHRELQTFVEAAQETGGIDIGRKKRIIKVIKTPVPRTEVPQILDALLGHEFFHMEWGTDLVREFHLDPSPEARREYWAKLDDVAQEIRVLFESILKRGAAAPSSAAQAATATIYLAATSSDLQDQRDILRRELQDRGHTVLPENPLPWSADQLTEAVDRDLKRSQFSIHLLGARYGIVPEGESRSIIELQAALAAQQPATGLHRIIWIPPGLEVTDDRQKNFLETQRLSSDPNDRFELLETSLENLKTHILDRLREAASPPAAAAAAESNGAPRVYVVCEQRDRPEIAWIRQYLMERGYEVILAIAKGEPDQIRQDHLENLMDCDAVLIYWGNADEFWLRTKMRDLIRVRGLGRKRPFSASAVVLAEPANPEKDDFVTRDALVIRAGPAPSAESLEPFASAISGAARG
jgi:hypothetical protein